MLLLQASIHRVARQQCVCVTAETEIKKVQWASEMTGGCLRLTLEPEHRLMTQENNHYEETLEILGHRKSKMKNDKEDDHALYTENQVESQLKKPRRKDTPVLNSPPHIPGARMLRVQKQIVHLEDDEKDEKE